MFTSVKKADFTGVTILKANNRQFTIAIIVVGVLVCALIMAYFTVFAPKVDMPDLSKLQGTPAPQEDKPTSQEPITPAPADQPTVQQAAQGTPAAAPAPVEFGTGKAADVGPKAEEDTKLDTIKAVSPAARLAPDMFSYSALPFDAPLAEFPLVLVGQKNLEWYKAPREVIGGSPGGIGTAPLSIYGRPPSPPPKPTPPPGGGGPPGPPEKPPKPPPEVSTSGL